MMLLSLPPGTWTMITFGICAVLAILGAVGVVFFAKPVYSALSLALVMISLAVIYASLGAPFLFAVQIIVYTGAVLMLFLFVIMLVGRDAHDDLRETLKGHRPIAIALGVIVLVLLTLAVLQGVYGSAQGVDAVNTADGGNVQGLASLIFSRYVIAFEATAALLITAAVAAMVLAHPERLKPKVNQPDRAAARLEAYATTGAHPGPNPNSGVFARHNSVATPALLPDGSVAVASLSPVLVERTPITSAEELWAPHDAILAQFEDPDNLTEAGAVVLTPSDLAAGELAGPDQSDAAAATDGTPAADAVPVDPAPDQPAADSGKEQHD